MDERASALRRAGDVRLARWSSAGGGVAAGADAGGGGNAVPRCSCSVSCMDAQRTAHGREVVRAAEIVEEHACVERSGGWA